VACLRRAGHRVGLLAPRGPGSALLGPGPGEIQQLLPWEAAATAELFTGAGVVSGTLREALGAFDGAVAYTRSPELARNLDAALPRLQALDPEPPAGAGHASRWLARPLSSLGVTCDQDPPALEPTVDERERAATVWKRLPEPFVAVHPGSGSVSKNWPADRFGALLDALGADRFLLIEGPADAEAALGLRARPGAITTRELSPRDLGAALSRAAAFVGNDSGVTHVAAAWGAPTLALFGPTDPATWSPVGPRVRVVKSTNGRMDGIRVEAVLGAVAPLLAG
jgi:glycosyl transferase family 9 (putative heptosyltransferase)